MNFEYQVVTWSAKQADAELQALLNEQGAQGWEAVGLAPRGASVPMPGMGAKAVPDMAVILKRQLP